MNRPKITTSDVAPTFQATVDAHASIATEDIDRPEIAVVTGSSMNDPVTKDYLRDLAFMEDIIEFIVAKTKDKNDPNPIIAGNSGQMRVIELGKRHRMARKFLDSLINTVVDISTSEYTDDQGLRQTKITQIFTPSLQIQIINDPSPYGMEWFARAQHGAL